MIEWVKKPSRATVPFKGALFKKKPWTFKGIGGKDLRNDKLIKYVIVDIHTLPKNGVNLSADRDIRDLIYISSKFSAIQSVLFDW